MLRKSFEFKVAADGLQENEIAGYGSAFNNIDSYGEVVELGAFASTIPFFIRRGFMGWQHDWARPIGKWDQAHEDAIGLDVKGHIVPTELGKEARLLVLEGVVQCMSIGYEVPKGGWRELGAAEAINRFGAERYAEAIEKLPWWRDSLISLTKIDPLYEVSLVTVPANDEALILGAKASGCHLSFVQRSGAVVAALRDLHSQFAEYAAHRESDGRQLSEAKQAGLRSAIDEYEQLLAQLKGLLPVEPKASEEEPVAAPPTPEQKADLSDLITREMSRFELTRSRIAGVGV